MEHLLTAWEGVVEQFRSARHVMLLTDYDGTLTPIVERPELADLGDETRQLLKELARKRGMTVGIVSGRALSDLKAKTGIDGIIYAGNHGLEIEGPGMSFVNPLAEEVKPVLRVIYEVLRRTVGTIRGVFVENKELTLSIHYRQVPGEQVAEVKRTFDRAVGGVQAMGKVRVTEGKKVYEVRPAVKWDKGRAIRLLIKRYGRGQRGLLPAYIGDDLTDEDGFRAINEYPQGISVFVGEKVQRTVARYYLESPGEVVRFLDGLVKAGPR